MFFWRKLPKDRPLANGSIRRPSGPGRPSFLFFVVLIIIVRSLIILFVVVFVVVFDSHHEPPIAGENIDRFGIHPCPLCACKGMAGCIETYSWNICAYPGT